ncbi:hypothetical protein PhCBS80983_g01557 [Powellomyces hirtus]|uniref:RRM domain-containing protein n=1 Tax=Powellomyces hirtus TaxID=109895 RepID=A0A507EAT3_9FUNG|nr:hypothetical protein PhCBS80983_g01557 [Powellomyces hirtus]
MASALDTYPTLFVSGLLPSITEMDLVDVLNNMQMETKVDIESVGRVKLIFRYLQDAERYYATVNGSMFLGAKVHVTFKDPNMNFSTTSGAKSILCKHIPLGVTSLAFYDFVRPYGRIISCKVMIDRSGTEAYALLQFENQDNADQCLGALNGATMKDNTLALSWQFPKNSPYQYPTARAASFTGSIPEAAEPQLSAAGPTGWGQPTPPASPSAANMPPPSAIKTPNRPNPHAAPWSPAGSDKHEQPTATAVKRQSQPIRHAWETPVAAPAAAPLDDKNLYVKNLEDHVDNPELFNMFRKFGRIVSARVMRDETLGKSKGFGFVSFETSEMAAHALAEMNGKPCGAKNLVVNVAEPKGYRQSRLAAIHSK